jgi:hypothetical protein
MPAATNVVLRWLVSMRGPPLLYDPGTFDLNVPQVCREHDNLCSESPQGTAGFTVHSQTAQDCPPITLRQLIHPYACMTEIYSTAALEG